jgi:hypothetical protein
MQGIIRQLRKVFAHPCRECEIFYVMQEIIRQLRIFLHTPAESVQFSVKKNRRELHSPRRPNHQIADNDEKLTTQTN